MITGKKLQVCCEQVVCPGEGTESERDEEAVTAGGQIDRELHQDLQ